MRRMLVSTLAVLIIAALVSPAHPDDRSGGLARVQVDTIEEAAYIAALFDETHRPVPGHVEVYLWSGDAARLDALGYDYDITIEDLAAHDARQRQQTPGQIAAMPGPDRTDYRRLADYETEMAELADKRPDLVKLLKLPHKTLEGRDVLGVEIATDVKANDGRPTFYVDGVHHAREWPAGEYPMIFAHYLAEGFGKDAEITRLLKQIRVVIVPIVNPDGFHYSREFILGQQQNADFAHSLPCGAGHCGAYWRKNRRSYTNLTVPVIQQNPDAYGIDVNRNYSYKWGGVGSSNTPIPLGDQTYRGASPFSEPESENVRELILSDNVTALISHHTSGNLVLRPWADTQEPTPDERYLAQLGDKMARALGGYRNDTWIRGLYPSTGNLSDWAYGTLGIPSYTFEHGTAFHPPYTGCTENCVEEQWPEVMKALMHAAWSALDMSLHGVIKGQLVDRRGKAVEAKLRLTKKFSNPLAEESTVEEERWPEKLDTTLVVYGRFVWHVASSTQPYLQVRGKQDTYELTVTRAGGGTRTFTFVLKKGQVLDLGAIRL